MIIERDKVKSESIENISRDYREDFEKVKRDYKVGVKSKIFTRILSELKK